MKVDILGTKYTIIKKDYQDDEAFERRNIDGYCDDALKEIVVLNLATAPAFSNESKKYITQLEKETLRHEVIHAFLSESGLQDSASRFEGAWSKNEEMIDWIAIQFQKIVKVFEEVGCI
ncbi:MAG: hypothetical protein PHT76_11565 [Anaerostipes sp.]|nr:hypothetical protein [Anaerostipes sp.]